MYSRKQNRDWELVPIKDSIGKLFGLDVSPREYKELMGDLDLYRIGQRKGTITDDQKLVPFIRMGTIIDEEILEALIIKNCTVIPVLLDSDVRQLEKLSDFAKEQATMLSGRVYSCVKNWLESSKKEHEQSIYETIQKHRWRLQQMLKKEARDWEIVINVLVSDVLNADENITILNLFEDFIGNVKEKKFQKKHSLEVSVLATVLAKKCGIKVDYLQNIAFAGLIHDIGILIYEKKLKEVFENDGLFLDPPRVKEYYQKHPIFSALMLTRRTGETIHGINKQVRDMILQHEQKIDGTGPVLYDNEFSRDLKIIGIERNTRYYGYNIIPNDKTERRDLLDFWVAQDVIHKRIAGNKIMFGAQLLHIAELYVTSLELKEREKIPSPHLKVVKDMIAQAGTKINGKVFEVFFNYLIPKMYYPDKLIVNVQFLGTPKTYEIAALRGGLGILHTKKGEFSEEDEKVAIVFRDVRGKELKKKIVIYLNDKQLRPYLVIDDWKKYDKELYTKLQKELKVY